jgi:hypothetical protein
MPLSPTAQHLCRRRGGTIDDDHDLEKVAVGNEPEVSGGLGSQAINAQWQRRHVAPAFPMERELPASLQIEMRTAHRLRSAHDN